MQSFVWNGSKAMASKDAHDDLIISIAIGLWLAAGDSTANDQGMTLAYAMLKATSRGFNALKPPMPTMYPQLQSLPPSGNSENQKKSSEMQTQDNTDFSWLLK